MSKKLESEKVNKAIAVLKNGDVIIVPTDTVYGFIVDATNKKAVDKIYKIKKRPKGKPLAVFVSSIKMAKELAEIDEKQAKILKKFWPGKYTFILKRNSPDVGPWMLYGQDRKTIALRIPKNTFLQKLLKKINRPLVQTSVNISGESPLINIEQIQERFSKIGISDTPMLIIDGGNLKNGKPSKIIGLTSKNLTILR